MQLVAPPRPRFAVIPTKSASLSRRGRGLHCTMVFLLFDQVHGEIVGFVRRKVGLRAGRANGGHAASGLDALVPQRCIAVRNDLLEVYAQERNGNTI